MLSPNVLGCQTESCVNGKQEVVATNSRGRCVFIFWNKLAEGKRCACQLLKMLSVLVFSVRDNRNTSNPTNSKKWAHTHTLQHCCYRLNISNNCAPNAHRTALYCRCSIMPFFLLINNLLVIFIKNSWSFLQTLVLTWASITFIHHPHFEYLSAKSCIALFFVSLCFFAN